MIVIYATVLAFSHDHEFLKSDNRHIMFYVFKRGLEGYKKLVWIPVYFVAMRRVVVESRGLVGVVRLACIGMSLVGSRLIEIRYFIVPALLLGVSEPGFQVVVNVIMLGIYAKKYIIW